LQMADEMSAHALKALSKLGKFLFGILHAILADIGQTRVNRFLNMRSRSVLGHADQNDLVGISPDFPANLSDFFSNLLDSQGNHADKGNTNVMERQRRNQEGPAAIWAGEPKNAASSFKGVSLIETGCKPLILTPLIMAESKTCASPSTFTSNPSMRKSTPPGF